MSPEWASIAVGVLVPCIAALLGWNFKIQADLTAVKIQLAASYHTKSDIDAIVERLIRAVGVQIKAEMAPLRFRLGEVCRKLNIPPEQNQDEPG